MYNTMDVQCAICMEDVLSGTGATDICMRQGKFQCKPVIHKACLDTFNSTNPGKCPICLERGSASDAPQSLVAIMNRLRDIQDRLNSIRVV